MDEYHKAFESNFVLITYYLPKKRYSSLERERERIYLLQILLDVLLYS